ncbi:MAG: hypothetical protein AAF211_31225 [Myxococcota bacterium]
MTAIGLKHYGGTRGLYEQDYDEQVRALAYYAELEDRRKARRARLERERKRPKPRRGQR